MRVSALHLLAYGPFTTKSLVFGAQPGLHVIYGDNEAGKSTTLRAFSSVLFGYPHEVEDGYQHGSKDIALGAELVGKDGQTLSFQRRRRGKSVLVRADGTPLDDATLAKMLGGVSRDVFERVFALDHQRLHDHARALLSEGGSLGFTLAAAASGLSGLKATLDRLKVERAALFLPSGSRPKINQRVTQLVELRKEARRRSVSPAEYKKRQREIDEIEAALVEVRAKDRELETVLRKLERITRNLPIRAQHIAVVSRVEALIFVPVLSADASQKRIKAETDRDTADADLARANEALAALNSELSAIVLDKAILDKGVEIDVLSAQRAVIDHADKSLPRRDAERAQHYATVRDLLTKAELGGSPTELATLMPSLIKRKEVSILITKGRTLATQEETLIEGAALAEEDLRLAGERLSVTEAPADMTTLHAALLAADTLGDIRSDIVKRTRVLDTKTRVTREGIVGLGLEQGDASTLRKLSLPSDETVAHFRQSFATADADQTAQAADLARLRDDLEGVERRIEKLGLGGIVATKEELVASRKARDEAWSVVRGLHIDGKRGFEERVKALTSDGDLAGAFERRQKDADLAADAIIANTKEAAELSLFTRQKVDIVGKIAVAESKSQRIGTCRQELEVEWTGLWPLDTARVQSPAEMSEWLKRREALLREDIEQQTEFDAIAELEGKETSAIAALFAVLRPLATVESNATLAALRTQARTIVDVAANVATKHAKAAEALESGQQRKRQADAALGRIRAQMAEWSTAWKAALRDAGLKEKLSIDAAATILEIMIALDGLKPQIDELSHRIETMTDEKADFEAAIAALGPLAAGSDGTAATEISRQLEARLKIAKAAEATLSSLHEQQKIRSDARRQASERLARSKAALAVLCAAAGCEDANALVEIERKSASKQEATRDQEQLEKRLREDGAGLSLEALMSECESMSGDTLPGSIATHTGERAELAATIERLMTERASLRAEFDALFGQNQAAEALQDAANVEADIAILTHNYTDLTLQEIALRQAIDLYRDRNQGPILGRAKTLFVKLTDGAYSGLRADIDENDSAILIAEHSTRGSLEVGALSDGTVDPLYLALRLAVVQERNAQSEPLPFIADDLLLNLDNTRAQAALRTLAEVAKTDQVLFFTHNEHMVELARHSVPKNLLIEHRL